MQQTGSTPQHDDDEDDEFFDADDAGGAASTSDKELAPASASGPADGSQQKRRDEGAAAKSALERVRELNAVGRHAEAVKLLPSSEWVKAFGAEKEAAETRAYAGQVERALEGARHSLQPPPRARPHPRAPPASAFFAQSADADG